MRELSATAVATEKRVWMVIECPNIHPYDAFDEDSIGKYLGRQIMERLLTDA